MLDPSSSILDAEFIAFDLETTGCSPDFSEIVEIGAVRFRLDGTEIARFQQLVDPRCRIPAATTAVHGITDDMVADQPPIEEALPKFLKFLGDAEAIGMAHNAAFDVGFLNRALHRCNEVCPLTPVIDTVRLSRRWVHNCRRYTLAALGQHFGVADYVEHRGLSDSLVLKDVFLGVMREGLIVETVGDFLRLAKPKFFRATKPPEKTPCLPSEFAALQAAADSRSTVLMKYQSAKRGVAERSVTPRKFVQFRNTVYLLAFCHTDRKEKQYRLDRIRDFHVDSGE
ncbi:exonuclease domain-containing protein [Thalassoroseus pseudoceratinae]|uniref:exonuclease domain-containing protein n=1 Tax=Thalassoroseus pseudoceratinae TaxID=2713176 RepID=UPI0014228044|nr:exonuclease domain-containing protein [Thalassoroseus pseudoceratinae]